MDAAELLRDLLGRQAAFTLVDIEAGLVTDAHVNAITHAVFHDFNRGRRLFAAQQFAADRQTLTLARGRVGSVEDRLRTRDLHQQVGNQLAMSLNACRLELSHEAVGVLVDDQAGQTIRLAENETHGTRAVTQTGTSLDGVTKLLLEPRGIDHLLFHEGPAACADSRFGRIGCPSEETAV